MTNTNPSTDERLPVKFWSLKTCAEQLAYCGYECEAGALTNNDAFIWLKQAAVVGPEFLPGQGVFFEISAEAAGQILRQWAHFYIVGCHMDSDTDCRFWTYDLSNDPPRPYHYGTVQFSRVRSELLKLEKPT
jgi:hypothetical protein